MSSASTPILLIISSYSEVLYRLVGERMGFSLLSMVAISSNVSIVY